MKKTRYTDEQIAYALRQAELGTSIAEVVRKMGVSEQTFYRWKGQYAGIGVGEIRRLKQLEEENQKLKQLVADLSLNKLMLQDVLSKRTLRPGRRPDLVRQLEDNCGVSERRGCRALRFQRSSHRYRSIAPGQAALRMRIKEIAATRVRYSYDRIYILLRREGWTINHML